MESLWKRISHDKAVMTKGEWGVLDLLRGTLVRSAKGLMRAVGGPRTY